MAEQTFSDLSLLSEAEILIGLGRSVSDSRLGMSSSDCRDKGEGWISRHRAEICKCLSAIPLIRQLMEDSIAAQRTEAMAALCDFLALAYGKTTAMWAAVFVLRVGLRDFCATCPQDSHPSAASIATKPDAS